MPGSRGSHQGSDHGGLPYDSHGPRYGDPAPYDDQYRPRDSYDHPDNAADTYGQPSHPRNSYDHPSNSDRHAIPPQYRESPVNDSFHGSQHYDDPQGRYTSPPEDPYDSRPPQNSDYSNDDGQYRNATRPDEGPRDYEDPYRSSAGRHPQDDNYQNHPLDEQDGRYSGLPPVQADPFADDPFHREGYNPDHRRSPSPTAESDRFRIPGGYDPDDKRGPSPIGSDRYRNPGGYEGERGMAPSPAPGSDRYHMSGQCNLYEIFKGLRGEAK